MCDRLLDADQSAALLIGIETVDQPGVQRVTVAGELDALTATTLQKAVVDVLRQQRPSRFEINLREVTFLDSAGIRALVLCHFDAERVDCQLTVIDPHPMAYRALEITGLLDYLGITGRRATSDH